MILVYTNSKERAMRLATALDGVVLRNKQKIRASNYNDLSNMLEQELVMDGYIRAFFRGVPYVFVYSDGPIKAPCKMVDYDASYASFNDRPIPFLPEEFQHRYIDHAFEERIQTYHAIIHDAEEIVNAASDDIEGELCFLRFMDEVVASGERGKYRLGSIKIVHPCTMNEADVMDAFAIPDMWEDGYGASAAAARREYLEWLVSCNATNALTKFNLTRRLIPVGRLESAILALIAEQDREENKPISPSKAMFSGVVQLTLPAPYTIHGKSEVEARILTGFPTTEKDGNSILQKIKAYGKASVMKAEHTLHSETPRLLNLSTLQQRACERCDISLEEISDAINWLYLNGYITWPTSSDRNPWSNKSRITKAVSMLSQDPLFADRIGPSDVEDFLQWDSDNSSDPRTGVCVTENALPPTAPKNCLAVYQVIVDSLVDTMTARSFTDVLSVYLMCDGYKIAITDRLEGTQPFQPKKDEPLKTGVEVPITDAHLLTREGIQHYTTQKIIESMLAITSGRAYWNDSHIFSNALYNLVAWKHLSVDKAEGTYLITEEGKRAYSYIRNTILADISEIVSWDLRLAAVAQSSKKTDSGARTSFFADVCAYAADIVASIEEVCNTMKELGGFMPSDFTCPLCGGDLDFHEEGGCNCRNCKFVIPDKLFGHVMRIADVGALVTKGTTPLITDFVSAKGTYAARITLNEGKLNRSFVSPYPCPKCGKPLNEYAWGVKCADDTCSFSMNTTIRGHHLTDDEIMTLVTHGKTKDLNMVSQRGSPFKAKLSLAADGSVQFDLKK